jgi:hypothetical protein
MARPSAYNAKLAERVLEAVCNGASLTEASAAYNVKRQTVRSWLDRIPAFASAFEAAKLVRVEALADQINILAESAQQVASDAVKAGENPNAAVAALRVQCENKRWLLAKLAPAVYGDRQTTELTGPEGRDLIPAESTGRWKVELATLALILTGAKAQGLLPTHSLPPPPTPLRLVATGGAAEAEEEQPDE